MRKRMLAMLLAVMMILSLLPTTALAAGSITELKLMQGDSAVFDLLKNSGGTVNLDVDTQYTLSMQLSSPTTLTITLPEGMKFVSLNEESLKGSYEAVTDVTWQKGSSVYNYQPDNGTLTVQFDPGTESTPFSVQVQPDLPFVIPEESTAGFSITDAIQISMDGQSYTADASVTGSRVINPYVGNIPNNRNFPCPIGGSTTLGGNIFVGHVNDYYNARLVRKLSVEFTTPAGITNVEAVEDSGWTITKGATSGDRTTWAAVYENFYSRNRQASGWRVTVDAGAADGTTYTVNAVSVTVQGYGETVSHTYSSTEKWHVIATDPNAVHLTLNQKDAQKVYKYDTDNYQTQFGTVRIVNNGVADINKALTYKMDADTTVQFVTRIGVPCYYSEANDTWMPTKIVITDEDGEEYTITGVENIRNVASWVYEERGFTICAEDIPGFDTTKSIKSIEVTLPGLPEGYASTQEYSYFQGNGGHTDRATGWGRVRSTASDGAVGTNTYSFSWEGGSVSQTATTTVELDSNVIAASGKSATFSLNGGSSSGSSVSASAGDVIHVQAEIGADSYNGGYHECETIIYDPVIYLVQPSNFRMENVTFSKDGKPLTISEEKQISPAGLPSGYQMWEYHLTDTEGNPVLAGYYDGDWNTTGVVVDYDLTVLSSTSSQVYDMKDLIFGKSSLGFAFGSPSSGATGPVADKYNLNGGENLCSVSGTINIQQSVNFSISSAIQIAGEDDYYQFDPENAINTSAIFGQGSTANIQVTVTNYSGYDADHVEVYIPVPKKDDIIFTDAFKSGEFGFDMYAVGVDGNIPSGWKVEYATVSSITGDASTGLTFNVDSWDTTPSNADNLIRLSLDTGSTMANATSEQFVLKFRASDDEEQLDQRNLFKSWWSFSADVIRMYDSSTVYNFGTVLQSGVVEGYVYGDTNRNSVKDADEVGIADVKVTAEDANGRIYETTTGTDGKYRFDTLPGKGTITITVTNPGSNDPNAADATPYWFSPKNPTPNNTGAVNIWNDFESADGHLTATATLNNLSSTVGATNYAHAGLMPPLTVNFGKDANITSVSPTSTKVFIGQSIGDALKGSAPTVVSADGYFHSGWKLGDDGVVMSTEALMATVATAATADATYIAVGDVGHVEVTYEQGSGKASTQNNDPLLIIGTVTGNDEVPEGNVFFMFSGDLTEAIADGLVDLNNTESVNNYAATITRVLDSSKAWAEGELADSYNGYATLQPSNITFANEDKYKTGDSFTSIPAELLDLPVRVAMGHDTVTYYKEGAAEAGFTAAYVVQDPSQAEYRVVRTYEYTTLVNGGNQGVTLGDLLDGDCKYDANMTYSDVAVYQWQDEGGTWKALDGYTTGNVTEVAGAGTYEVDFSNIKQELLNRLNSSDNSLKFWNKRNASFGLAITYEYISDNICLTKYVPDASQADVYSLTNSPAVVSRPEKKTHTITPTVYVRNQGEGDDAWQLLSPNGLEIYEINYDQELKFEATDSDTTVKSAWFYAVNPEDGLDAALQPDAGNASMGSTASWTYTPATENGTSGAVTVYLVREAYATYSSTNVALNVMVNGKTNAVTPTLSMSGNVTKFFAEAGKPTLTVSASVSGGESNLTYQWYKSDTQLNAEAQKDLAVNATKIDDATTKSYTVERPTPETADKKIYYYVEVTNTATGAAGTGTATAVGEAYVQWLAFTEPTAPNLGSGDSYNVGDPADELNGTVNAPNGSYTITYQWYSSNDPDAEPENYNSVGGATGPTYTPPTTQAGTTYYYVKVTSTRTVDGVSHSVSVNSAPVTIGVGTVMYTLTYDPNGGSGGPGARSYATGTPVTLDQATKPTHDKDKGYEVLFVGWSADKDDTIYSFDSPTQPSLIYTVDMDAAKTVYAVWSYDTNTNGVPDINETQGIRTLTYVANGNTGTLPQEVKALAGTLITLDNGSGLSHDSDITGDIVFAGWSASSADSGKILKAGDSSVTLIKQQTMPNNDTSVYAVWGYDLNGDNQADVNETSYTLTYDTNGGTNGPVDSNKYVENQKVTLDTKTVPTRAAADGTLVFIGWTADQDETLYEAKDNAPSTITEVTFVDKDITVYAAWGYDRDGNGEADVTETDRKVTLTYDGNAQSGGSVDKLPTGGTYVVGQEVTLVTDPKPTHSKVNDTDVVFIGWTTSATNEIYAKGDAAPSVVTKVTMEAGGNTVYAAWGYDTDNDKLPDVTQEGKYKLIYDANGGSGGPSDDEEYSAGREVTLLTEPKPTHGNTSDNKAVVFIGWTLDDTKEKVYTANDTLPQLVTKVSFAASDITVYAVWAKDTDGNGTPDVNETKHTLTYDLNGGLGTLADSNKYVKGSEVTLVTVEAAKKSIFHNPVDGKPVVFLGWTLDDTDEKVYTANDTLPQLETEVTFGDADVTVFAVWGKDTDGDGTADIEPDETKYHLTYDDNANDGIVTKMPAADNNNYVSKETVKLSTTRPEHDDDNGVAVEFIGWAVGTPDGKIWDGQTDKLEDVSARIKTEVTFDDANIQVYALWGYDRDKNGTADIMEGANYGLVYDANGGTAGSVPTDSKLYKSGDEATLLDEGTLAYGSQVDDSNVVFMGWSQTKYAVLKVKDAMPSDILQPNEKVTFTNSSITMYAVWGVDSNNNGTADVAETHYTLTYDNNGGIGSVTDGNLYVNGNTVTLKTKTDVASLLSHGDDNGVKVAFIGWSQTKDTKIYDTADDWDELEAKLTPTVTFADASITVYAIWGYDHDGNGEADVTETSYSLTYDANGGTGAPTDTNKYVGNQAVPLDTQTTPTHPGDGTDVVFIGWTTDQATATAKIYAGTDDWAALEAKLTTSVRFADSNITVYAVWGYDTDGGGIPDITEGAQFSLTYHINGGNVNAPTDSKLYASGETATLHNGTGLTHADEGTLPVAFIGWSLYQYGVLTANDQMPTVLGGQVAFSNSNILVYAVWGVDTNDDGIADVEDGDGNKYTLTYELNGGSGNVPDNNKYVKGSVATLRTKLELGNTISHADVDGAKVVFIGWTADQDPHIYEAKDQMPAIIPSVTFDEADITVWAVWGYDRNNDGKADVEEPDDAKFDLTYDANGGNAGSVPTDDNKYVENQVVTLDTKTTPTHPGDGTAVVFIGWSEEQLGIYAGDGDLDVLNAKLTPTVTFGKANKTVYAVWGYDTDGGGEADITEGAKFSLSYNLNGGNGTVTDSQKYQTGSEVPLKTQTDAGDPLTHADTAAGKKIAFIGWSTDSDTAVWDKIYTANDQPPVRVTKVTFSTGDITVYALWGEDTNDDGTADVDDGKYQLFYDANGGVGGPVDSDWHTEDAVVALAMTPVPTHDDVGNTPVEFVGWTLTQDTTIYAAGQESVLADLKTEVEFGTENITVYALWGYDRNDNGTADVLESGKYHLTYNTNAQEGGSVTNEVTDDTTYIWNDIVPLADGSGMIHTDVNGIAVVFAGWTASPTSQIYSFSDTAPSYITEVTFDDADIEVYAVWSYDENGNGQPDVNENLSNHSLTYVITGASAGETAPATEYYLSGTQVTLADGSYLKHDDQGKDAVVFAGWTMDANYEGAVLQKGDQTQMLVTTVNMPERNVTVYAVWGVDADGNGEADALQKEYTLTYNANGGSGAPVDNNKYAAQETVTLDPGSTMTHYAEGYRVIFAGWSKTQYDQIFAAGEGGNVRIITSVTFGEANETVYAVWSYDVNNNGTPDMEEAAYGLTYDANGGSGAPVDSKSYVMGQMVTLDSGAGMTHDQIVTVPADPDQGIEEVKSDVLFVGWSLTQADHILEGNDADRQYLADNAINSVTFNRRPITVYAMWGVDADGDGKPDVTVDADGDDLTFDLIYNANGGTGTNLPATTSHVSGETVTLAAYADADPDMPTHDSVGGINVVFAGWTETPYDVIYTENDKLPVLCTEVTFVTSDITVYAVWGFDRNNDGIPDATQSRAFLTYDVNGGDPDSVSAPGKYLPGDVVQLTEVPTHAPADYYGTLVDVTFEGWSLTKVDILKAGDTKPAIITQVEYQGDDVTVYAVWSVDYDKDGDPDYNQNPVTLTYEPNGGRGSAVTEVYPEGSVVSLKNNVFTRPSYKFLEWNDMADGKGTAYAGSTTLTADLVLYAQWKYSGGNGGGSTGGGSGSSSTVTIIAEAGEHGKISPSGRVSVTKGDDITFTIGAEDGYVISDVLVDGKSVGPVSEYTFKNVTKSHTIEVVFAEDEESATGVMDPTVTGVADWLETEDHIQYLQGKSGGLFGPGDNMTRAEVAQMFYNLLLNKNVPVLVNFSDVPSDAWYATAVNALASMGILKGTGGDKFEPLRTITRAEFTTIAMRFAKLDTSGVNIFTDVPSDAWYYDYIVGSVKYGWINGYGDGTFRPENLITRAEVTIITNRMLGRSADKDYVNENLLSLNRFSDVSTSNYAYYDIMEATNDHEHVKDGGVEYWTDLNK